MYCLRADNGALAWRFLAAPAEQQLSSHGQLESVWPVHGSVVVQGDGTATPTRPLVYFTAGRSTYLDGGIHAIALDPWTGEVIHENCLSGPHPDPLTTVGGAGYMDGAKSDLLVSDGADIYLFQDRFRSDLKRVPAPLGNMGKEGGGYRTYPPFPERGSSGEHLITTHGFLVDADNEGKYWTYGARWPGWDRKMNRVPANGQLLVFDADTLYGVHVFTENIRVRRGRTLGREGQRLFARDHEAKKDRW